VAVALAEIAIGLLVTTGVATRPAASAGLALNALLFFTNSWHTYPYFLGPDIVFVFAWLPFVLVGATRQPTLEPALHRFALARARTEMGAHSRARPAYYGRSDPAAGEPELTRRAVIRTGLGLFGAASGAIAGFSLLTRGTYRPPRTLGASARPVTRTRGSGEAPGSAQSSAAAQGVPSGAVKLGSASQVAAGQSATYTDPSEGTPDIVIRQSNGGLVAYSAVCTHAGCTVGYEGGQIVCPCHGAVYDPQTGAVLSGPAPAPLAARKVLEHGGEIYALPG
jgi:thiosulfate dehydrogenase [quinone] large subunit